MSGRARTPSVPRRPFRKSKESQRKNRPSNRLPHLFGRGGRDRVLIALAVNGALHVRHIGRLIGSDSHKVWNMVERLRETGLVVKRNRAGGRKYVQLNRRLPIHRLLVRLLLALDKHWPAKRGERVVARWHMPFDKEITPERLDEMFCGPIRSRVLLFVAAVGTTDMTTMVDTLGLGSVSALYAVNHWEREGILRSRNFKTRRLVELNPRFIVARELKMLLREIIAYDDEYKAYRPEVQRKMRSLLTNAPLPKKEHS